MIGLNVAYANSRGISIPVNSIIGTISALISDGRIRTAHLGISTDAISLPRRLIDEANVDQDEGLLILAVEPNSPARKAGLVVGDILVTFDKTPITVHSDLYRRLTKDAIGKPVEIGVLRAERLVKLTITPNEDEAQ